MQRNPNIDILKGIGILSVIIAHLTQIWLLRGLLYSFHMPLFFLASGYFFITHLYLNYYDGFLVNYYCPILYFVPYRQSSF